MPANLEPIDTDGMAYRVVLDGERIGIVSRYITMGETNWQTRVKDEDAPQGVFSEKDHAVAQLVMDHVNREKR